MELTVQKLKNQIKSEMARAKEVNKPTLYQGNSIAMDNAHSKDSAKKVLKKIKAVKKKADYWLEDITQRAKYEFHSKEQFRFTVKKLHDQDNNKVFRSSHPRILNQSIK